MPADRDFVIEKLKDADPRVREAAVRVGEPLLKANDAGLMAALKPLANDPDPNVVIAVLPVAGVRRSTPRRRP